MNCSEWRLEISAYIDSSLQAGKCAGVEKHLQECVECASFYAEQSELNQVLQAALPDLEPPSQIWRSIESRLALTSPVANMPDRWSFTDLFRMPRLAFVGVAAAFILMLGLLVFDTSAPGREQERLLAELEAFSIETEGNPFLTEVRAENPFFKLSRFEPGNPFDRLGGSQQ